jgi:hypothetical protein
MTILRLAVLLSLFALTAMGQQNSPEQAHERPASCPVTSPPAVPFTPPAPYQPAGDRSFLLGNQKLWTTVRKSGEVWGWGPRARGHERDVQPLTAKTYWASVNFKWDKELSPALKVTGRRLDGNAPPLVTMPATNAFPGPAAGMLVGVYVPTPGCWEITGDYKGQKLSFVVWVHQVKWATSN